ncbi:MAG: hypothetical protein KJ719_13865 [Gammaproteobacteria bacterium]|nr:hypothetical protein [Gammaproteobacteria bacterium]MBU4005773.1 hypothetical protein [Gammaproteobacteria bacterium]MBU4021479.1 hypothetical protein [Gammaproteobacteria bacterium]MBU4097333.1 hypothetical protein [Gammaproteobacteria bacterium]
MKTKRTLIAVCIATLFASGAVMAKEKWEYNEDKWDDTRSYGGVNIDQDSVEKWGPWEEFIQPAAGAPSIAFMGAGVGDPYRTLPQTNRIAEDVCRAGDWCGYATYYNYRWDRTAYDGGEGGSYSSMHTRPYAGVFGLTLQPDDPSVVTIDGGEGPGKVSWRVAALPGNASPDLGASHDPMNANFGNWWYYYHYTGGLHNFSASQQTSDSSYAYDYSMAYGYPHDYYYYYYWYLPTNNKEVAAGYFYRYINDYISGDGAETGKETYGFYVAGIATPQPYLDAQRAGNVTASYQGNSYDFWSGHQIPVSMTVNFGTASWNGSWNNGQDGYAYQTTDSYGNKYIYGQVGFNASGTVSGANIQSTSVSALDGTVTGKVQGTFYGQTAGSIGGVHDIVKTVPDRYTAASNVGVFLVDKAVQPQ